MPLPPATPALNTHLVWVRGPAYCQLPLHTKVHDQGVHGTQVGAQADGQSVEGHIVLPRILNDVLHCLHLQWIGGASGAPLMVEQCSKHNKKRLLTSCFITASNCCATPLSPRVRMSNTLATDMPPPPAACPPVPVALGVSSMLLPAEAVPATSAPSAQVGEQESRHMIGRVSSSQTRRGSMDG